jgi:subtilisin family serine protease
MWCRASSGDESMERIYTILLDRGGRFPARNYRHKSEFEQPLEMASRLMADPPRPAVHRERLTAQELEELSREPEFVAAAEVMKTRLLAPIPDEGGQKTASLTPDGTRRQSWGVTAVGADKSKFTGAGVPVAVLDTGIDADHPAFDGVDLLQKDFTGFGNGDHDGHGTHCAGIVFGRNLNGHRIGVAPGVRRALVGKIIGPAGGDSDMMIRGVCWAHEEGARVISMSVGFDFAATEEERSAEGWPRQLTNSVTLEAYRANLRLLDRLLQMLRMQEPCTGGAIMVAAAGNDSSRGAAGEFIMSACPPAGSDKIISVGSIDRDTGGGGYRVSAFSNSGVEIVGPGRGIVSAWPGGGVRTLSGTSVAAPHVAGVAALWWQAVRQSDLPANATLVRGMMMEGAQSKGFSRAVCLAERGAGRAMSPRDGGAIAVRGASVRPLWSEEPLVEDLALHVGRSRVRRPTGSEPISIDAGGDGSGWFPPRRGVC